ncbi:protein-tyrosine-phosphatase [Azospirillum brasilense]|uniref:Protein-tyrosine-phosphatase n=1 Tax=Azospirillum brasilense TaxID=192 RepID=A0A0P0EZ82_AZOBR|nr:MULTISPECIES: protein-tyrosine-phosphatase [Azospirillum]ALJ36085.1 protein tyrosine phosphatase [Azospirillum brasilense]MDW7552510.1 protein-tyrosine-phosphatase [Azospirillum brasilense]MDW7592300.1 protein-tyrosine-phosphatase [Azospirillum brasilense]MDW7627430.1 protein-tyrosine-phosphatase [Azospirillum brasilense]MDX5954881.1 protein-tyrosine-phosphatase [Azospirillum brasilense]
MARDFVPFGLTVCGIEELNGFCEAGVTHVLSILDPGHPEPTAFGSYGEHKRLELRFHDIIDPYMGQSLPQRADVERILAFGRDLLTEPTGVGGLLVHCHAGISRSTAALTMILAQASPDRPAAEAMAAVVGIRHKAWPNLRMIEFADEILERRGELVDAVRARHRSYGRERPDLVQFMIDNGRVREVADLID